jgi:hypothetical protein
MTKLIDNRLTDAIPANIVRNLKEDSMGQLRTANKRHKRTIAKRQARSASIKPAEQASTAKKAKS